MNWLRTSLFRSRATLPFNLSRWFAIVGLVSITVVGTASALLLSNLLTNSMLLQEGTMTMQFLQGLVTMEKSLPAFITGERMRETTELQAALRHIAALPDATRVNLYNLNHDLIWSTDREIIGHKFEGNPELEEALNTGILVVHGDVEEDEAMPHKAEHVNLEERGNYFVEVYVPVRDAPRGKVIGVIELYKSPKALADALRTGRFYIFFGAAAAGIFLYLALFGLARRADALIRTQRERLVESEILAAVGEMSSAVAHGIRNPLASIRSSAELALDGAPENARETAQDIIDEADRLEEWIRDFLSFSRPIAGASEAVALPGLVDTNMDHFAREMEKRNISGISTLAPDLPQAKGNAFMLGQVLHSLIANSVEAIGQGGTIEIAGKKVPGHQRVELTVRDSGPGMTEAQLERAFTPFYTTKPKGLGVGLALAKRIVERFGGRITIDSAPGRGTTVCLSMPVA